MVVEGARRASVGPTGSAAHLGRGSGKYDQDLAVFFHLIIQIVWVNNLVKSQGLRYQIKFSKTLFGHLSSWLTVQHQIKFVCTKNVDCDFPIKKLDFSIKKAQ